MTRLRLWYRRAKRWVTRERMTIRIANLTPAQQIALEDLLATWVRLGNLGASRWTAFYADGDGDFHPWVRVGWRRPRETSLLERNDVWRGDEYRIDYDAIAWRLRRAL